MDESLLMSMHHMEEVTRKITTSISGYSIRTEKLHTPEQRELFAKTLIKAQLLERYQSDLRDIFIQMTEDILPIITDVIQANKVAKIQPTVPRSLDGVEAADKIIDETLTRCLDLTAIPRDFMEIYRALEKVKLEELKNAVNPLDVLQNLPGLKTFIQEWFSDQPSKRNQRILELKGAVEKMFTPDILYQFFNITLYVNFYRAINDTIQKIISDHLELFRQPNDDSVNGNEKKRRSSSSGSALANELALIPKSVTFDQKSNKITIQLFNVLFNTESFRKISEIVCTPKEITSALLAEFFPIGITYPTWEEVISGEKKPTLKCCGRNVYRIFTCGRRVDAAIEAVDGRVWIAIYTTLSLTFAAFLTDQVKHYVDATYEIDTVYITEGMKNIAILWAIIAVLSMVLYLIPVFYYNIPRFRKAPREYKKYSGSRQRCAASFFWFIRLEFLNIDWKLVATARRNRQRFVQLEQYNKQLDVAAPSYAENYDSETEDADITRVFYDKREEEESRRPGNDYLITTKLNRKRRKETASEQKKNN